MMSAAALVANRGHIEADEHAVAKDLVNWALALAGAERAQRVVHMGVHLGPHPHLTTERLEHAVSLWTRCTIAEGASVKVAKAPEPGVILDTVELK